MRFCKQDFICYDFQAIEESIGFSLPADYKYYLNNYQPFEDYINDQYISLYNFETVSTFNRDISEKDKLSSSVLIGSNGASESIGLQFSGDFNYRAVIAQYMFDSGDYIEIGASFTDMLQRLSDGVEWFEE